jgi:integrase
MGRNRRQRRQQHGSAWHWKQTDCWYYTQPGTKKRLPLFDESGRRIRGKENQDAAETALAKTKVAAESDSANPGGQQRWLVAKVCLEYLQYCERGAANGTLSKGHRDNSVAWLNDLCSYCGALAVGELKKGHVKTWLESHSTWRSAATRHGVITIVQAAFNYAEQQYEIPNPLKGLKKPVPQPRLQSFSREDEETLYDATEVCFRNFLFAAIHTGLRPYCELARVTAEDIEENGRGMMWRVYASKTKKTRKIPVRRDVADLTRKLLKTAPRGSGLLLFRNTKGKPWKRMTGVVRFCNLKKKLKWDSDPTKAKYSSYSCRHTFAHRMLSGYWAGGVGCSIETLAELIGDTPKVAFDHYGKEWGQHYQDPLWAAIGAGTKGDKEPTVAKSAAGAVAKSSRKASKNRPAAKTRRPTKKSAAKSPAKPKGRGNRRREV